MSRLPVHFFTIVLNGEPWIRHHIEAFKQLPFDWHWHVVEGVASLTHDTAWSLQHGGRVSDQLHHEGRSNDGTSEYLDELQKAHPDRVTVYRKPRGQFWDGKLEMVSAPMPNLPWNCLLWQVDADELWTPAQIGRMRDLFLAHPEKRAAYFYCHFFVGSDLLITSRNTYGNNAGYEWIRVWRKSAFQRWLTHEPPVFANLRERIRAHRRKRRGIAFEQVLRPDDPRVFSHAETEAEGLLFQHMAYVIEPQLAFKEIYYGYTGAVEAWHRLQDGAHAWPVKLKDYFPWVKDEATVAPASALGVTPLMRP